MVVAEHAGKWAVLAGRLRTEDKLLLGAGLAPGLRISCTGVSRKLELSPAQSCLTDREMGKVEGSTGRNWVTEQALRAGLRLWGHLWIKGTEPQSRIWICFLLESRELIPLKGREG